MKRKLLGIMLVGVLSVVVLVPSADAKVYRFKQWIAPLECTRTETNNGVDVTVILTPAECDDLLHPKPPTKPTIPDDGGAGTPEPVRPPTPEAPGAPNTGFFRDPIVRFSQVGGLFVLAILLLLYARRKKQDDLPK